VAPLDRHVPVEKLAEAPKERGFCEIWLADYSGFEVYMDIEMFDLYPAKSWGHHEKLAAHELYLMRRCEMETLTAISQVKIGRRLIIW
jgi:hypothetical protein